MDIGIRKNPAYFNNGNSLNDIDMTGSTTPKRYVDNVISKILKEFFDSHFVIKYAAQKIISEILSEMVADFENRLEMSIGDNIADIKNVLYCIVRYIHKILFETNTPS